MYKYIKIGGLTGKKFTYSSSYEYKIFIPWMSFKWSRWYDLDGSTILHNEISLRTRVTIPIPDTAFFIVFVHKPVGPLFRTKDMCYKSFTINSDCILWVAIQWPWGPGSPFQPLTLHSLLFSMYIYQFGHSLGLTRNLLVVEPISVNSQCPCGPGSPFQPLKLPLLLFSMYIYQFCHFSGLKRQYTPSNDIVKCSWMVCNKKSKIERS